MTYNTTNDIMSRIKELERRIRDMETAPRASSTSIDSGGIRLVDDGKIYAQEDGVDTLLVGKQFDGSFGAVALSGPTPPIPSLPIVSPIIKGLTIAWDGLWKDDAIVPMDFSRIEVHVSSTPDYIPDASTLTGTIETPRGAIIERTVAEGTDFYYVKFVARTLSGKASHQLTYLLLGMRNLVVFVSLYFHPDR